MKARRDMNFDIIEKTDKIQERWYTMLYNVTM